MIANRILVNLNWRKKFFFGDENFLTKSIFFSEEEILENWKWISGPEGKMKRWENRKEYRIRLEEKLREMQAELSLWRREEELAYNNFIQSKNNLSE